ARQRSSATLNKAREVTQAPSATVDVVSENVHALPATPIHHEELEAAKGSTHVSPVSAAPNDDTALIQEQLVALGKVFKSTVMGDQNLFALVSYTNTLCVLPCIFLGIPSTPVAFGATTLHSLLEVQDNQPAWIALLVVVSLAMDVAVEALFIFVELWNGKGGF
ncbi:hypothetical protein HDU96_000985, partial [Phlyctochytrium bullatum]